MARLLRGQDSRCLATELMFVATVRTLCLRLASSRTLLQWRRPRDFKNTWTQLSESMQALIGTSLARLASKETAKAVSLVVRLGADVRHPSVRRVLINAMKDPGCEYLGVEGYPASSISASFTYVLPIVAATLWQQDSVLPTSLFEHQSMGQARNPPTHRQHTKCVVCALKPTKNAQEALWFWVLQSFARQLSEQGLPQFTTPLRHPFCRGKFDYHSSRNFQLSLHCELIICFHYLSQLSTYSE